MGSILFASSLLIRLLYSCTLTSRIDVVLIYSLKPLLVKSLCNLVFYQNLLVRKA